MHLHLEVLIVIGTGRGNEMILKLLPGILLDDLLQLCLIILEGVVPVMFDLGDHETQDMALGGFHTAVKIDSCDQRFKGVGNDRRPVRSAVFAFSVRKFDIGSQVDLLGKIEEAFFAYERSSELSQL